MDLSLILILAGAVGAANASARALRTTWDTGLTAGLLLLAATAFLLGAGTGLHVLWASQLLYVLLSVLGWFWLFRRPAGLTLDKKNDPVSAILLFFSGLFFWSYEFRDLAGLPSAADGIHHAYFLWRMLETGEIFSGRMIRLWSDLFGTDSIHFYPTGSHFLAAILGAPAWFALKTPSYEILRNVLILALSIFPVFLFLGSRKLFPAVPRAIPLGAAALSAVWYLFPGDVLGEGGFSRLLGCILVIPPAIALLDQKISAKWIFASTAFGLPTVLIIHPQALFIFGPALLWATLMGSQPKRSTLALLAGGLAAGGFAALLLRTGSQLIATPEVLAEFNIRASLTWSSFFDRAKGLIHYWFTDRSGFGKFLSPKSLLLWAGLVTLWKTRPAWQRFAIGPSRHFFGLHFLMVFCLPFLIFLPGSVFQKINMLFYQQNKRMAELGFFPLYFLFQFGAVWVYAKSFDFRMGRFAKPIAWAFVALAILWTGIGAFKIDHEFSYLKRLYDSPRRDDISAIRDAIQTLPQDHTVFIPHAPYTLAMMGVSQPVLFTFPECVDSKIVPLSPACVSRMQRVNELKRCLREENGPERCWSGPLAVVFPKEDWDSLQDQQRWYTVVSAFGAGVVVVPVN